MLNRTVHPAPSAVQVPVPYRLAQQLKTQGYDLNRLIRELLEDFAASSGKLDTQALQRGHLIASDAA
ncbi:hypothetical protein [Methylococcus sp. EFPC2]|uniref:hypothetical protein n=1 Tax=Methylococcus sp. EFPC2 TaxID=2812648 RepID=UPI001966D131|nr:hypothetical protein [Methylococcus sp. EFPC2]QSA98076.1 hypothetical protein JWZ97_04450 [Methylococcus sp. EFPC2]